jgi:hypothetical protein
MQTKEEMDDSLSIEPKNKICFICNKDGIAIPLESGFCNCKNDLSTVHRECLYTWIRSDRYIGDRTHCPTCKAQYRISIDWIKLFKGLAFRYWRYFHFFLNLYSISYGIYFLIYIFCFTFYIEKRHWILGFPVLLIGMIILILSWSFMIYLRYPFMKENLEKNIFIVKVDSLV